MCAKFRAGTLGSGAVDAPTTLDYVTLGIAAVGAVTGIAALGATWAQFMLSGARVRVTTGTAMPVATQEFLLYVAVENVGRMPTTVHGLSLDLPNNQHVPLGMEISRGRGIGPPLPHRMEPGEEQSWYFEVEPMLETFRLQNKPTTLHARAATGSKKTRTKKKIDLAQIARNNQ